MTITERAAKVLQQIDAALALAEKATPGPWEKDGFMEWGICANDKRVAASNVAQGLDYKADAAFIAASRTLVPKFAEGLKTAIEVLLACLTNAAEPWLDGDVQRLLTTLCDQWESTL